MAHANIFTQELSTYPWYVPVHVLLLLSEVQLGTLHTKLRIPSHEFRTVQHRCT